MLIPGDTKIPKYYQDVLGIKKYKNLIHQYQNVLLT